MSSDFVIVDVETTGGDPKSDRITEIAVIRYNGEEVTETFQSLINPEMPIPDFITGITGINNGMVAEAPKFYEIARNIVEITENAIFVAHNARFDYSFIQKEFRRLGYKFSRKQLCTVKLSRKKIPGLKSYSLGKLCTHLKIENKARHRAMGDAEATFELFQLLQNETPKDDPLFKLEISRAKLPPNMATSVMEALPDETGVYYFHDREGEVLYVGKSNSIRKRVLSHFQGAYKANRTIRMLEQIHDISFEITGSELVALLLENEEIKRLQPPYNRAQRRKEFRFAVYVEENKNGYLRLFVDEYDEARRPVAGFTRRSGAEGAVVRRGKKFELCPKLYDMERGPGRCFHSQLHICRGACVGEETPEDYNQRVREAVTEMSYGRHDEENFLVVGEGRHETETSVVWVEKGIYQGFAFLDQEIMNQHPQIIIESIPHREDAPDVQRIIYGYIKRNPMEVVTLNLQEQ